MALAVCSYASFEGHITRISLGLNWHIQYNNGLLNDVWSRHIFCINMTAVHSRKISFLFSVKQKIFLCWFNSEWLGLLHPWWAFALLTGLCDFFTWCALHQVYTRFPFFILCSSVNILCPAEHKTEYSLAWLGCDTPAHRGRAFLPFAPGVIVKEACAVQDHKLYKQLTVKSAWPGRHTGLWFPSFLAHDLLKQSTVWLCPSSLSFSVDISCDQFNRRGIFLA